MVVNGRDYCKAIEHILHNFPFLVAHLDTWLSVGVGNSDEEKSRARLALNRRFIFWLMLCLTSLELSQRSQGDFSKTN